MHWHQIIFYIFSFIITLFFSYECYIESKDWRTSAWWNVLFVFLYLLAIYEAYIVIDAYFTFFV